MKDKTKSPVIGVGVLLANQDGSLLIGHRANEGEPSTWCLPWGRVEPGETFTAAAVRELAEETGISGVQEVEPFGIVQDLRAHRCVVTVGLIATAPETCPAPELKEPHVFSEWAWASMDALPSPLYPACASLLALLVGAPLPEGWVGYQMVRRRREG